MSEFRSRGYARHTRFVETEPSSFPAGTILKLDLDDETTIPRFIVADGSSDVTRYMHLDLLTATRHTPFTGMGYNRDTVFRVIEAGGFSEGELVKIYRDDGSNNPMFQSISVAGKRHYVTFSTRLRVVEQAEAPAKPKREGEKYNRTIKDSAGEGKTLTVDVYSVLEAFGVNSSAIAHAVKKLLAPGKRGVKSAEQDIREAIGSLERALKM